MKPGSGRMYWSSAPWDHWPRERTTKKEAVADGEEAREKEIQRLEQAIKAVRDRPIEVIEYDPPEMDEA